MPCFKNRVKRAEKKYKKSQVIPDTNYYNKNRRVDKEFLDHMGKEALLCGGCRKGFSLRSEEIKIHCNGCDKFFHCKIAGKCQGKDCCIQTSDGLIHRASYCYSCSKINYRNDQCLCKDCFNEIHC